MDKICDGEINIKFGNGLLFKLFGTVTVNIFFGKVNFYFIKTDILFFLLLKNINRLKIYLNNVIN